MLATQDTKLDLPYHGPIDSMSTDVPSHLFRDTIGIIFRRKKIFLSIFLFVILTGGLYLLVTTPKYLSTASLVLRFGGSSASEANRPQALELSQNDRREIIESHSVLLRSHDLAQDVINAIGLYRVYPEIASDPPKHGTPMDMAIRKFQDNLDISVGQQSNVITISLLHPDMDLVPKLVQTLIDSYMQRENAVYRDPQIDFGISEVNQSKARLDTAQTALNQFNAEARITSFDDEVTSLLTQRSDVENNLRNAQAGLGAAEQRRIDLEGLMKKVPKQSPTTAGGEKYRSLDDAQAKLLDLRAKEQELLATYRPGSPVVQQLHASIESLEDIVQERQQELDSRASATPNVVYQTMQTEYLRAVADSQSMAVPVKVYGEQLGSIDSRLDELQKKHGAHDDLVRQVAIAEESYKTRVAQYDDERAKAHQNEQRISRAAIISTPTIPYRAARPRKVIVAAVCLVGGFLLALGGALTAEAMVGRRDPVLLAIPRI